MISTRDLSLLPDVEPLKRLTQALAVLDAIIEPDWELRYHSFDALWAPGEALASMRDGSGDSYFLLFHPSGAILKGFAHESPMSPHQSAPPHVWPGVLDTVPQAFTGFLTEAAFSTEDTTFCIWHTHGDAVWQRGNIRFADGADPDGSASLLALLDGEPQTYQRWAQEYYERPIDTRAVAHVYAHRPLTARIIKQLNPDLLLADATADLEEIGYGHR